MDELHMCHYCGQPLEDLSQLHDITHCAKYAIETSIPTLQKRVEELEKTETRLRRLFGKSHNTGKSLRASISKAVEEIEEYTLAGSEDYVKGIWDGTQAAADILHKHGVIGGE